MTLSLRMLLPVATLMLLLLTHQVGADLTEMSWVSEWNNLTVTNVWTPTSPATPALIKLGLINGGSSFFDPVEQGFRHMCSHLQTIECYYAKPPPKENLDMHDCEWKDLLLKEWVEERGVQGIAFKACNGYHDQIDKATAQGVPIVSFDGDAPNSTRTAYIGTDQEFMGRTLARLLKQLRPEGGTFALIAEKDGRTEGFTSEIMKDNDREGRGHWYPAPVYQNYTGGGNPVHLQHMMAYAEQNVSALIFLKQSPMKADNYTDVIDLGRKKNITYLGVDGADYQLAYLNQKYVDGLVGQLPWDMGVKAVEVLLKAISAQAAGKSLETDVFPTNLVAYNLIPLELPDLQVEQNLLGNLKIIGLLCFAIVAASVVACIGWTLYWFYRRSSLVVAAAQPFFLIVLATGILIMSATLIPLSWDDNGADIELTETQAIGVCMSQPWLGFMGFSITFAALFSKTWRVNQLVDKSAAFGRTKVNVQDVLGPFAVILLLNMTVLIVWTAVDPLTYRREFSKGTDLWNRELESIGSCQSEHAVAFLVPLALINFAVVVIACWQAIKARSIKSEFSESKYIGLAVFSMSQAFMTGLPIVVVVKDIPQAFYLVLTFLIFLLCMVVLLLIFLPKMIMQRKYSGLTTSEQKKLMSLAISVNKNNDTSRRNMGWEQEDTKEYEAACKSVRGVSGLQLEGNVGASMSRNAHYSPHSSSNIKRSPITSSRNNNRSSSRNNNKSSIVDNKSFRMASIRSSEQTVESSATISRAENITSINEDEEAVGETVSPITTVNEDEEVVSESAPISVTRPEVSRGSVGSKMVLSDLSERSNSSTSNTTSTSNKLFKATATALFRTMISLQQDDNSGAGKGPLEFFLSQVDLDTLSGSERQELQKVLVTLHAQQDTKSSQSMTSQEDLSFREEDVSEVEA